MLKIERFTNYSNSIPQKIRIQNKYKNKKLIIYFFISSNPIKEMVAIDIGVGRRGQVI